MIKGKQIIDEGYRGDELRQSQAYSHPLFSAALHVIESELEKEAALSILEKNPDLLLVDGSFLGFAYSLFRIRKETEVPDWLEKKAKHALDITNQLLDSRKCAGVVKRGRSRAIGGWLSILERRRNPLVSYLDKQVLQGMMRTPSTLDYKEILGQPGLYRVYTRVSELLYRGKRSDPDEALMEASKWATSSLAEALGIADDEQVRHLESRINRVQVKVSDEAPPFELEIPVGAEEYVRSTLFSNPNNFDAATGLPLAIDLVDEYVSLPMEFTKEFVAEVEARLAQIYEGDLDEVRGFFANMNPQKEM